MKNFFFAEQRLLGFSAGDTPSSRPQPETAESVNLEGEYNALVQKIEQLKAMGPGKRDPDAWNRVTSWVRSLNRAIKTKDPEQVAEKLQLGLEAVEDALKGKKEGVVSTSEELSMMQISPLSFEADVAADTDQAKGPDAEVEVDPTDQSEVLEQKKQQFEEKVAKIKSLASTLPPASAEQYNEYLSTQVDTVNSNMLENQAEAIAAIERALNNANVLIDFQEKAAKGPKKVEITQTVDASGKEATTNVSIPFQPNRHVTQMCIVDPVTLEPKGVMGQSISMVRCNDTGTEFTIKTPVESTSKGKIYYSDNTYEIVDLKNKQVAQINIKSINKVEKKTRPVVTPEPLPVAPIPDADDLPITPDLVKEDDIPLEPTFTPEEKEDPVLPSKEVPNLPAKESNEKIDANANVVKIYAELIRELKEGGLSAEAQDANARLDKALQNRGIYKSEALAAIGLATVEHNPEYGRDEVKFTPKTMEGNGEEYEIGTNGDTVYVEKVQKPEPVVEQKEAVDKNAEIKSAYADLTFHLEAGHGLNSEAEAALTRLNRAVRNRGIEKTDGLVSIGLMTETLNPQNGLKEGRFTPKTVKDDNNNTEYGIYTNGDEVTVEEIQKPEAETKPEQKEEVEAFDAKFKQAVENLRNSIYSGIPVDANEGSALKEVNEEFTNIRAEMDREDAIDNSNLREGVSVVDSYTQKESKISYDVGTDSIVVNPVEAKAEETETPAQVAPEAVDTLEQLGTDLGARVDVIRGILSELNIKDGKDQVDAELAAMNALVAGANYEEGLQAGDEIADAVKKNPIEGIDYQRFSLEFNGSQFSIEEIKTPDATPEALSAKEQLAKDMTGHVDMIREIMGEYGKIDGPAGGEAEIAAMNDLVSGYGNLEEALAVAESVIAETNAKPIDGTSGDSYKLSIDDVNKFSLVEIKAETPVAPEPEIAPPTETPVAPEAVDAFSDFTKATDDALANARQEQMNVSVDGNVQRAIEATEGYLSAAGTELMVRAGADMTNGERIGKLNADMAEQAATIEELKNQLPKNDGQAVPTETPPTEEPSTKPYDNPAETPPTDKPEEKPTEKPADKPSEDTDQAKEVERLTEEVKRLTELVKKLTEELDALKKSQTEKPTDKPVDKPTEPTTVDKPAEKPKDAETKESIQEAIKKLEEEGAKLGEEWSKILEGGHAALHAKDSTGKENMKRLEEIAQRKEEIEKEISEKKAKLEAMEKTENLPEGTDALIALRTERETELKGLKTTADTKSLDRIKAIDTEITAIDTKLSGIRTKLEGELKNLKDKPTADSITRVKAIDAEITKINNAIGAPTDKPAEAANKDKENSDKLKTLLGADAVNVEVKGAEIKVTLDSPAIAERVKEILSVRRVGQDVSPTIQQNGSDLVVKNGESILASPETPMELIKKAVTVAKMPEDQYKKVLALVKAESDGLVKSIRKMFIPDSIANMLGIGSTASQLEDMAKKMAGLNGKQVLDLAISGVKALSGETQAEPVVEKPAEKPAAELTEEQKQLVKDGIEQVKQMLPKILEFSKKSPNDKIVDSLAALKEFAKALRVKAPDEPAAKKGKETDDAPKTVEDASNALSAIGKLLTGDFSGIDPKIAMDALKTLTNGMTFPVIPIKTKTGA